MIFDEKIQLIVVGECNVGKTSIMKKYTKSAFTSEHLGTVGLDYFTKDEKFENKIIRLKIWDTAGQEQFRSLTRNFYRNSDGAIVVFDVSNRTSFFKVQEWIQSVLNNAKENVKIALVANKIDLEREVSKSEGKEFANLHKILYYETSAKENLGIDEMIRKFTLEILEVKADIYPSDALYIENKKRKKEKCNQC